jgi:hypothetical protein
MKNGDPHYLVLHATSMIKFCVSLSKAAIKALTQDIIWYENEEIEINGKQHTALVPRLYLAHATLDDLSKTPQAPNRHRLG